jgi:hypothetical protein
MPHNKEMEPTAQKTRRGSFPGVSAPTEHERVPTAVGIDSCTVADCCLELVEVGSPLAVHLLGAAR